ncbi:MAG: universal stress protein [Pseudomonadota bacterium]
MYQKIMVPLDGSELAECVLPHVEAFLNRFQSCKVVFVRVVNPIPVSFGLETSPTFFEEAESSELAMKSSAEEYLNQVVAGFKEKAGKTELAVLMGRTAESLIDFAESQNVDLIIIATHGRSGISRWVMGSVADRILHSSHAPILMIRAQGV